MEQRVSSPTVVPSFWKRMSFTWSYARAYAKTLTFGMLSMISREAIAFTIPLLIRAGVGNLTDPAAHRQAWPISMIGLAMVAVAVLSCLQKLESELEAL